MCFRILSTLIAIVLFAHAVLADLPGMVQISVDRKIEKGEKPKPEGEGSEARLISQARYTIKLANASFADLKDLKVDYLVFVEKQKLGTKRDADAVTRVTGSDHVPLLTRAAPVTLTTRDVPLSKSNLVGNYYFANGGRIKVEDTVKGIWVRVSQSGKIVGEYSNPGSITQRGWDAK